MVKLIACDIDGTLLFSGGSKQIDSAVFQEVQRLMAQGVHFCPASGRQVESLRRLFSPIADQIYCLADNGANIFGPGNPGPLLGQSIMDRDKALTLARQIMAKEECEVLLCGAQTGYLCPKREDLLEVIKGYVGNSIQILPCPEAMPENIVKVSAYVESGAAAIEPDFAPQWSREFQVAIAGQRWLDFTTGDKGSGIAHLCRILGISKEEVMAFGDNYNDVPMLDYVGIPFIMDNAVEDLRNRYPNHCRRVEDILKTL